MSTLLPDTGAARMLLHGTMAHHGIGAPRVRGGIITHGLTILGHGEPGGHPGPGHGAPPGLGAGEVTIPATIPAHGGGDRLIFPDARITPIARLVTAAPLTVPARVQAVTTAPTAIMAIPVRATGPPAEITAILDRIQLHPPIVRGNRHQAAIQGIAVDHRVTAARLPTTAPAAIPTAVQVRLHIVAEADHRVAAEAVSAAVEVVAAAVAARVVADVTDPPILLFFSMI